MTGDYVSKIGPLDNIVPHGHLYTIKEIEPSSNITVKCGDGCVVIDMKTGAVTLDNCTLDAGAKAFWDAVAGYAGAYVQSEIEKGRSR